MMANSNLPFGPLTMMYDDIPYEVAPMRISDLQGVMEIELQSFSTPWTAEAYRYELRFNANAYYYVVRSRDPSRPVLRARENGLRLRLRRWLRAGMPATPPVLGYVGFWLIIDEVHISTIAVHPEARRRGLGELLLLSVFETAWHHTAGLITLEVRVSNHGAQRLYEKYGFQRTGRRKGYYSDNREDAWIMTVDQLWEPAFEDVLEQNMRDLRQKLIESQYPSHKYRESSPDGVRILRRARDKP